MWHYPECAHVYVIRTPASFRNVAGRHALDPTMAFVIATMTDSDLPQRPRPGPSTYARSLDILARAPRSIRELRRRLLGKGESEGDVEAVITRLTAAGLLDDAAYARAIVHAKVSAQAFSRRRLQLELAKRGVAREIADAAITDVLSDEGVDEATSLERVARKKLRLLGGLDEATQRRRLFAYLVRRGYDLEHIRSSVRQLLRSGDQ